MHSKPPSNVGPGPKPDTTDGAANEGDGENDDVAGDSLSQGGDTEVAASAEEPATLATTGITVLKFVAVALGLMLIGWAIKRRTTNNA